MIEVFISHLGEEPLQGVQGSESCSPGTLREILEQIDARCPGFLGCDLQQYVFDGVPIDGTPSSSRRGRRMGNLHRKHYQSSW